jgi:hypothetical protein
MLSSKDAGKSLQEIVVSHTQKEQKDGFGNIERKRGYEKIVTPWKKLVGGLGFEPRTFGL